MKMKTDKEIDAEVSALKKLLEKKDRWNAEAREQMEEQSKALQSRMTLDKAEREYYVDETMDDYQDGDNDLWGEVCNAIRWMNGEDGYDAPSSGAE